MDMIERYNKRLSTFEPEIENRPIVALLTIIAEELVVMNKHLDGLAGTLSLMEDRG
jgi:hypothetical protein